MTITTPTSRVFTLGAGARCSDGSAGTLTRVVVDPRTREVTHLVIQPHHHDGFGRLVPVDRVAADLDGSDDVQLACTRAELATFDEAEEHHFLPGTGAYGGYGPGQALCWPYYTAGYLGAVGMGGIATGGGWTGTEGMGVGMGGESRITSSETVPLGEVAVHRGDPVLTTDGTVGHLHGLVLGRDDHRVSHLLLQEGHLWGRKQVAIPIGAVTSMADGVQLRLTTRQVHDLPGITLLEHPTH